MNETAGALGIIILLGVLNFMLIAVMFFRFTFIVSAIIKKKCPSQRAFLSACYG